MSKTVKRFILDDSWNIGRNECWFSEMAEKGLHLKSMRRIFASFEKGEPRKTKYRIDVLSSAPTEEQIEIYREYGWEFVTNNGELYIFSSPEEANYSELHTDPMEQSYTLTALDKRLRNNLIVISVAMVLFLGMMFSMSFLERTPTLSMISTTWIQRPLLVLVELYIFYTVMRNFIAVRSLKKSLFEGKPVNHRESWRKHRFINGFVSAFFIIIAGLSACIPFVEIAKSEDYTLPETSVNLPIIRLAEIDQNPDLEREVAYNSHGVDWGNWISYEWSLLAPVQYEVNEHGIVKNEMWEDNSGEYSPSIDTHYYKLTFSQMSDGLIHDLMERYVDSFDPKVAVQEMRNTFFDKLFVAEDGIRKQIFACYGNKIIYISYYGNVETENILTLLPQAILKYDEK